MQILPSSSACGRDLHRLEEALAGTLDIPGTAERWVREDLELRLACVENWVTRRTYARSECRGTLQKCGIPLLASDRFGLNIRSLLRITTRCMNSGA